ncbi:MAG: inorganic phosphate transporter [Lentisphaerae bacterium]|nr:inorganic phosphate transporter [Lentisphaerota bacterium]
MEIILILVVAAALFFDFANGQNDSANAIATVISTKVLSPLSAIIFATILNFIGALVSTKVAKTIGGGLVDPTIITNTVVLCSMLVAAGWVMVCSKLGLPVSGSHALIGSLVGAALAGFGVAVLKVKGLLLVLIALVLSPILGFAVGYVLLIAFYWIAARMSPPTVRRTFSLLQIGSSGFMAFTHGMNDAQKVMGVITLALFSAGKISAISVPAWVMLACATVMALGTAAGGWSVIKTLGTKLTHIRPIEGCAAETAAGLVLAAAAHLGAPVSTTHTITGSIMGVGTAYRLKSVKWLIGGKIISAWVLTLPVCAIGSALLTMLTRLF